MVVGAVLRVYLLPGPREFHLVIAVVLFPLGLWLMAGSATPRPRRPLQPSTITGVALAVGVVGGLYGIGGGSILGPVLVASGLAVTVVAPAALAATFVTSFVGVVTYGLLSLHASGPLAPRWDVGVACGLGGLVGGYLGARWQRRLPERVLRRLLGVLALALAVAYVGAFA